MLGLFTAIASDESIEWIFDATAWWLESFGAVGDELITPTPESFPVDASKRGLALVDEYLSCVQAWTKTTDWSVVCVYEDTPNVAELLAGMPHAMTSTPRARAGSSRLEADQPLPIPVELSQLDDPEFLVATLARGISHYLVQASEIELPVDDEDLEHGSGWVGDLPRQGRPALRCSSSEYLDMPPPRAWL